MRKESPCGASVIYFYSLLLNSRAPLLYKRDALVTAALCFTCTLRLSVALLRSAGNKSSAQNKSLGISKNTRSYPCLRKTGIYLLYPQKLLLKSPITSKRLKASVRVREKDFSQLPKVFMCCLNLTSMSCTLEMNPSQRRVNSSERCQLCPWGKFDKGGLGRECKN